MPNTKVNDTDLETVDNTPYPRKVPPRSTLSTLVLIVLVVALGVGATMYILGFSITKPSVQTSVEQVDPTKGAKPTIRPASSGPVDWLAQPQKVASAGFFKSVDQYYPYRLEYCKSFEDCMKPAETTDTYEPKTTYYLVGTMKSLYPGAKVYMTLTKGLLNTEVYKGLGTEKDFAPTMNRLALFIQTTDGKFIVPNDYENWWILCRGLCQNQNEMPKNIPESNISYQHDLSLDIAGTKKEYIDTATNTKYGFNTNYILFDPLGLYLVKDFGDGYQLYSTQDSKQTTLKLKTLLNPQFVLRMPTGLAGEVHIGPFSTGLIVRKGAGYYNDPYMETGYVTWTAGEPPPLLPKKPSPEGMQTDYTSLMYTSNFDGCDGMMSLQSMASDSEILDTATGVTEVGTTAKGEKVYALKNTDYQMFRQFWFFKVSGAGLSDVLPYQAYLDIKPILVWKNSLGVYKLVFRDDLVSSKCWAEPLIYLYPEQKTDITVGLSEKISVTEAEPPYKTGWQVTAGPDGKIYDHGKNRTYPYLYWEGSAPLTGLPVLHDVVASPDVKQYLSRSLTTLGLNTSEQQDFLAYWLPKFTGAPYYEVKFYDATSLEQDAPLSIDPKPDTTIRIMMDFERLNKAIHIPLLPVYQTPTRTGFTIVEWGGVKH